MSTLEAKRETETPKQVKKEKPAKVAIPADQLSTFLRDKLTVGETAKINQVAQRMLWNKMGLERYRINVWAKDSSSDSFCDSHYILRSFFVCYDRELSVITDKTI